MDEIKNEGVMKCGYYDIEVKVGGMAIGAHTYGRANKESVNFHCYGGVGARAGKEYNPVYPSKFYRWTLDQHPVATIKLDLKLARYIAANGLEGWESRKNYNKIPKDVDETMRKGLMDSAGLLYGVGGVCHQMANSIFTAETKTTDSRIVYPWSFLATKAAYGVRGNHTWSWNLPDRLKVLLKSYPKTIAEDVDMIVNDISQMLAPPPDTGVLMEDLLRSDRLVDGEDFLLAGQEGEYISVVSGLRQLKCDAARQLCCGEMSTSDFADEVNAAGARFAQQAADLVREDLALAYSRVNGLSVDKELMLSADIYKAFGDRANLS